MISSSSNNKYRRSKAGGREYGPNKGGEYGGKERKWKGWGIISSEFNLTGGDMDANGDEENSD